ncbi:DNA polymerase III subunit beta [Candidatus Peregrinibacteria bacterium]|nr:DNA polymerase III subunit beta [Candidatus Peregrinibacteria bacterium]
MRLICTQKNLANALSITNQAVDLNNTLPVLNNVYLKAEGQKLYLSATNLEIAISFWIEADVKNEGEITIPSKLFTSYINYLKGDAPIDLKIEGGDALSITTPTSKTKIKGIPASEFPQIPTIEREAGFKVSIEDLGRAINQVAFAASLNTTRPILSGVYFGLIKNQIELVATDSYRLAEKQLKATDITGNFSCIVPVKTIHQLGAIIPLSKRESEVEVVVSKNQVMFVFGEVKIISRLIDGQFPNYKQIIPKSTKTQAHFKTSELALVLKRINLFAKENNNKIVFHLDPEAVTITTDTTQYGEEEDVFRVKVAGEKNEVALNSQYVLDALSNIASDEVVFGVEGKANPATLQPFGDDSYHYIIMPLKM